MLKLFQSFEMKLFATGVIFGVILAFVSHR